VIERLPRKRKVLGSVPSKVLGSVPSTGFKKKKKKKKKSKRWMENLWDDVTGEAGTG